MKKEMLINVLQSEECRIAIVEDGVLEELYVERASQETYVGNIYKGKIVNIEPSIQAAFVDFGIGRNGFLHVSDVDPVYYKHLLPKEVRDAMDAEEEDGPPRARGGDRGGRDRDRDRGGRDRDRGDRDRGPRVARPEASVTVARPQPAAPADVDDEDEDGFGAGLVGDQPQPDDEPAPADEVEALGFDVEDEEATEPEVEIEAVVAPPRAAPAPAAARPEPLDPEESGFGEGINLDDEPAFNDPGASARLTVKEAVEETLWRDRPAPEPEAPSAEPEPAADAPVAEPPAAEEKPAKPRARRTAKKKDAEEPPAAEEKPAKPRARRTTKKKDADGDEPGPLPMGGAERRTSADDEEPEIRPFFEGGVADDFDPDAPNDRFGAGDADDDEPNGFAAAEADEPEVEAGEMLEVEGDADDAPPPRRDRERRDDRRDRGGRDRERRDDRRERPAPVAAGGFDDEEEEGENGFGGRGGDRGPRGRGRQRRGGPGGGRPPARDRGFPRPPIQEIFKRGQEVIVQVIKDAIGTKAPNVSTFISIAGRYLVLMPSLNRVGVSRKIEDPDARRRLRDIMTALNPPKGVGFIVRTAAIEQNEEDLRNDLQYLLRLWQVVVRRLRKIQGAVEVYRESDIITRTIRDILSPDIDTIWVDEEHSFATASDFLQVVMPRFASKIRHFSDTEPLFHKYGIEHEIAKINNKRIDLPQGGSIIIEQTEALVAIDVNSGTFRAENKDAEETAFRMNMLAAKEIARQLRLRDLGGVIVNDFIDMRDEKHRRKVEDTLRDALKRDRARTKILRISQFGIIEMTRQRLQPSLKKRIYNDCPHCAGTGFVKSNETMGIEVMRLLQLAAHRSPAVSAVVLTVHTDVAFYLLNRKRREIAALEERSRVEIQVNGQFGVSPDLCEFKCFDANGGEVRLIGGPPARMFAPGGRPPRQLPERRFPQPLD